MKESITYLFYRAAEYENIIISRERAEEFIKDFISGYRMCPVVGDGLCILHLFTKGYQPVVNKETTLNDVINTLRQERVGKKEEYQSFLTEDIDLLGEYKPFSKRH